MSIATARPFEDQTPEAARYSLFATRYSLVHGGAPL